MRFEIGQVYECPETERTAIVAEVHDDGRMGLLRFQNSPGEEWVRWAELHQAGKGN